MCFCQLKKSDYCEISDICVPVSLLDNKIQSTLDVLTLTNTFMILCSL